MIHSMTQALAASVALGAREKARSNHTSVRNVFQSDSATSPRLMSWKERIRRMRAREFSSRLIDTYTLISFSNFFS